AGAFATARRDTGQDRSPTHSVAFVVRGGSNASSTGPGFTAIHWSGTTLPGATGPPGALRLMTDCPGSSITPAPYAASNSPSLIRLRVLPVDPEAPTIIPVLTRAGSAGFLPLRKFCIRRTKRPREK